ncbi:hypothetical protein C2G38_2139286 [Gigaspora rosea]|uniref:Uncharacterized protein n=1 Tax=Gigaspora rosea TaxID=44941 RepID=A0A397VPB5_9GLOM|nr:hypothetical protein C2G38_2139286 [Gigaspora rosea]
MLAMFRNQPYLSTDLIGSLVITVATAISTIAVKVLLCDGTEILAMTKINIEGNSIELPFSLANIKPKLAAYNVIILFYIEDNNILVHTTYAKLYFLPVGPKTVKIDRLYGGILTSANETIFPVGPYVDIGGWLEKGNIQTNLQTLKDQNYNIINPDPPYPNDSFIHQMFQAADSIGGIYIQFSFRHDYIDIQKVINQVNQFKNYSSLLTWYIADEPDGENWTNSSAVFEAYEVIKKVDPYHPVSLTLNCQYSAAFYADATDILGTVIDQIVDLSKEIKDLSNYILFMPQLSPLHIIISPDNDVYAGVWMSKSQNDFLLITVNGNEKLSVNFRITIKDLVFLGLLHGVGKIDDETRTRVFIEDGFGQLNPDFLIVCQEYEYLILLALRDAINSQASLERNGVKGPIKKYDIFGVCKSENYDLELLLGEISYGPLDETYKHSTEDRIKLGTKVGVFNCR